MSPNWFIGFPVDSAGWYEEVITNVPDGIKSFNPTDLHITFAFLGPVTPEAAQKAWQLTLDAGMQRLSTSLGPMEAFGDPLKPSAYAFTLGTGWAQVSSYMQAYRDSVLAAVGREPVYKPRPHITVARPPRKAGDALRARGTAWATGVIPPDVSLQLDSLALYTWAENREIKQFEAVETAMLV